MKTQGTTKKIRFNKKWKVGSRWLEGVIDYQNTNGGVNLLFAGSHIFLSHDDQKNLREKGVIA